MRKPHAIVCVKVDTEAEQSLAASAHITSIPTLMGFRQGIHVFSQPRALPAASRKQVSASIRALDLDDVRTTLAESQPASVAS